MGGQEDAWADWCRHNTRASPGFTNEELYNKPASTTSATPRPPPPKKVEPSTPQKPPYRNLDELLAGEGDDLVYIAGLEQIAEKPMGHEPSMARGSCMPQDGQ